MTTSIGRYQIEAELGKGGFGKIYRAYDPVMRRHAAIKVLPASSDAGVLERFRGEAATTGNLCHKNIVSVFDYGVDEGRPYLVLELLEGFSLATVIEQRAALTMQEKMWILLQTAEGLLYAHERNVVHRDIKPSNVMLVEGGVVKLLDFGVARNVDSDEARQTMPGSIVGTFEYLSPEQLAGGDPDALSDIYCFGLMAYELLTGTHPFRAESMGRVFELIAHHEPQPIRQLAPDCPETLERIVQVAMAKERTQRYPSMEELVFDLAPVNFMLRAERAAQLADETERMVAVNATAAHQLLRRTLDLDPMQPKAHGLRGEIWQRCEMEAAAERARQMAAPPEPIAPPPPAAAEPMPPPPMPQPEPVLAPPVALADPAPIPMALPPPELDPEAERLRAQMLMEVQRRTYEHMSAGRLDDAAHLLEGGLRRYPGDPTLLGLLEQVQRARPTA